MDPAGAFVAAVVHPRNSPLSLVDVSLAIWGGGGVLARLVHLLLMLPSFQAGNQSQKLATKID